MTQLQTPRPPRRSNVEYRWTKPKILAFLHALGTMGSVARAARSVGMSRQSAYRLRAQMGSRFAAVWDEGLALACVFRRARAGNQNAQGDTRGSQGDRVGAKVTGCPLDTVNPGNLQLALTPAGRGAGA